MNSSGVQDVPFAGAPVKGRVRMLGCVNACLGERKSVGGVEVGTYLFVILVAIFCVRFCTPANCISSTA